MLAPCLQNELRELRQGLVKLLAEEQQEGEQADGQDLDAPAAAAAPQVPPQHARAGGMPTGQGQTHGTAGGRCALDPLHVNFLTGMHRCAHLGGLGGGHQRGLEPAAVAMLKVMHHGCVHCASPPCACPARVQRLLGMRSGSQAD